MNKTEIKQLFLIINNCYQNFQFDDVKVVIWLDLCRDIPFKQAHINLKRHIQTNKFPPTPADILQAEIPDPEIHERNKMIAWQQWVEDGHNPEEFIYEPRQLSLR